MQIWLMAIDTGSNGQPVYKFAVQHPQPAFSSTGSMRVTSMGSVVPIKGTADDLKVISSVSNEDAARRRQGVKIVGIGTVAVKTQLFDALRFIKPNEEIIVPNACHFPNYALEYFKGVCSEERIVTEAGKVRFDKKNSTRNEQLDCRVYAIAASVVCGIDRFNEMHWQDLEARVRIVIDPAMLPAPRTTQPSKRQVRGRFV